MGLALMYKSPHVDLSDTVYSHPERMRRLESAYVIWVNKREFWKNGICYANRAQEIDNWLIENFAYRIAEEGEPSDTTMFADRYGASGVTSYGGAGRAVNFNGYNIKGVGRTTLTSPEADYQHSSGFLWLSEAIRDVIASRIAEIELPSGCQPILALIDCGKSFYRKDKGWYERAALLVRPSFLRPAHFERSIIHGGSDRSPGDPAADIRRVVHHFQAACTRGGTGAFVGKIIDACARRVAECRANHLWCGRFSSDNVDVDGALCDFGAFNAVPYWRSWVTDRGERFDSINDLEDMARSLSFYAERFGQSNTLKWKESVALVKTSFLSSLSDSLLKRFRLDIFSVPARRKIITEIMEYVSYQMKIPESYTKMCHIFQTFDKSTIDLRCGRNEDIILERQAIADIVRYGIKANKGCAKVTDAWLEFIDQCTVPRLDLVGTKLEHTIRELVLSVDRRLCTYEISEFIDSTISNSLRSLSNLWIPRFVPQTHILESGFVKVSGMGHDGRPKTLTERCFDKLK